MTGKGSAAKAALELDLDAAAPAGALSSDLGLRIEFSGWAELAAAIEAWRTEAKRWAAPAQGEQRQLD